MRWRGDTAMPPDNPELVAVAILAKAPVPGAVKTRLVMMLGVDGAASLHERFLRRTVEIAAQAATGPITLWTDPNERHPVFRALSERYSLSLVRQPSGDLGARMLAAITQANGPALVIGTDCPTLTAAHLRDSADALRSGAEMVMIPADDGGYVLIGMRKPVPELFADMAWGTDGVMTETRRRLTHLGLSWREPAQLWDVDRPTDVRRMRREGLSDLLAGIDREPEPLR
jgi:rSAM/selenodomain-associated transferase 1